MSIYTCGVYIYIYLLIASCFVVHTYGNAYVPTVQSLWPPLPRGHNFLRGYFLVASDLACYSPHEGTIDKAE